LPPRRHWTADLRRALSNLNFWMLIATLALVVLTTLSLVFMNQSDGSAHKAPTVQLLCPTPTAADKKAHRGAERLSPTLLGVVLVRDRLRSEIRGHKSELGTSPASGGMVSGMSLSRADCRAEARKSHPTLQYLRANPSTLASLTPGKADGRSQASVEPGKLLPRI
jgi:hypothetical protein